jgi:hypothetical protein
MLHEAFGEHSLSQTVVSEWHSCFKACWVSAEDDEHLGWPSTSKTTQNVEKIREFSHKDHCWTIHELIGTVRFSYGVCREILTENLNMRHIAAKFVPQLLTNDQKQRHINTCPELQEKANEDPTFTSISRIITSDKSWICPYDPKTKKQSPQWNSTQSPREKRCGRSGIQQRACSLFISTWRGLFTVNLFLLILQSTLDSYCDILRRLRENVQQKRPELWRNHKWLLHQDNAPVHTSLKITVCD